MVVKTIVFDHYSKWLEIIKINFKTAQEVTHGYQQLIYSDNQLYSSDVFKQFCVMHNINLLTSSPRYPQSNGTAERAIQTA
jgi:transposase InsO family protein